jgi:hypothetical protein
MRKLIALAVLAAGLTASSFAFAEDAYKDLQNTASDSSSFDGGSGSTLDAPAESTDFQGQGTGGAAANS